MSSPNDGRPPLVDQDMPPFGTWKAVNGAFMSWESDDPASFPRGPLLPQVHPEGAWHPGSGNVMTWVPSVEPQDAPSLVIVDVPGDEDQEDAPVSEEIEQGNDIEASD